MDESVAVYYGKNSFIEIVFLRDAWPAIIFKEVGGIFKCRASACISAAFALFSMGGSFTAIL